MLDYILFVKKEIYYFGNKETHNVLCVEKVLDNGSTYFLPLTYSTKGKDGKYYNTYIINDNVDDGLVIDSLIRLNKDLKKSK